MKLKQCLAGNIYYEAFILEKKEGLESVRLHLDQLEK